MSGRTANSLRQQVSDPAACARHLFDETSFPDHAYGRAVIGDLGALATFTRDDLESLPRRIVARDDTCRGPRRPQSTIHFGRPAFRGTIRT